MFFNPSVPDPRKVIFMAYQPRQRSQELCTCGCDISCHDQMNPRSLTPGNCFRCGCRAFIGEEIKPDVPVNATTDEIDAFNLLSGKGHHRTKPEHGQPKHRDRGLAFSRH